MQIMGIGVMLGVLVFGMAIIDGRVESPSAALRFNFVVAAHL